MKVTIVKYLNKKGFIKEINKESLKGKVLPENIIEEYEVEIPDVVDLIEDTWLEDLKRKYVTGNYILLFNYGGIGWSIKSKSKWSNPLKYYKLIHNKHKDILEAYLKNSSVEIECTNYISKDADMETTWYIEEDFIENYNEEFWYRLKVKDLAWYEEKDNFRVAVKQIKCLNDFTDKEGKICIMEKITDNKGISSYNTNGYHTPLQWLECYRPATESEVLSLVYKPQQKVSKENILAESNTKLMCYLIPPIPVHQRR